jgi:hypothetical protein
MVLQGQNKKLTRSRKQSHKKYLFITTVDNLYIIKLILFIFNQNVETYDFKLVSQNSPKYQCKPDVYMSTPIEQKTNKILVYNYLAGRNLL